MDSILSAKILEKEGIKVKGLYFKSYFFEEKKAKEMAKKINLPLKVLDISEEHLKIVRKPKFGYGKGLNPCLDCRILILKKAKEILEKEKFDFLATGEVLGQRPMTQHKKAFSLIEKEAKVKGLVFRPLSAKILPETLPEKKGLIKREKFLALFGRSRKIQLALARKFKIENFPSPSGGCLLTDLEFSKRLKKLFDKAKKINGKDIELVKIGRHFWFGKIFMVVGKRKRKQKNGKTTEKGRSFDFDKKLSGSFFINKKFFFKKNSRKNNRKGKRIDSFLC